MFEARDEINSGLALSGLFQLGLNTLGADILEIGVYRVFTFKLELQQSRVKSMNITAEDVFLTNNKDISFQGRGHWSSFSSQSVGDELKQTEKRKLKEVI